MKQKGLVIHGCARRSGRTPEYRTWRHIIERCSSVSCRDYPIYGGRGIRVCDRWLESFENFLADMGRRPSPQHSIDRINNDGNYEPGNCRWATTAEQSRNRRTTRLDEVAIADIRSRFSNGESVRAIAAVYGVSPATVGHIRTGKHWAGVA